jgi:hypothetical protein
MNPVEILKNSLHITLRTWRLWALTGIILVVMIPAGVLGGLFGFGMAVMQTPEMARGSNFLSLLVSIPEAGWILIFIIFVVLLLLIQYINYFLQAASMRVAQDAAEGRPASIRRAVNLGAKRWAGLTQLTCTLGLALIALSCIPLLVGVLFARVSPWGIAAMQMVQVIAMPASMILGVLILLALLAIALEDLPLRAALRRAGAVLRKGWWCFLLAYMLLMGISMLLSAILVPIVVIGLFLALLSAQAAPFILAGCCMLASPIGLALMAFLMVFWLAMLTSIYRAASQALSSSVESKES